jgi:hypothetical protein
LSKNEADLLQSVRYNLALLCPETDGLLPKHRITYKPEGTTVEEQRADIVIYAYDKFSSLLDGKRRISQLDAHRISLIVEIEGFTQKEVFHILQKERYKRK